jgi:hypothetical protein
MAMPLRMTAVSSVVLRCSVAFLCELKYNVTYVDFTANLSIRIGDSNLAPNVIYQQCVPVS